jgi:hypothetical protein
MQYVTSICGALECAASDAGPLGCGATTNAAACGEVYQNFCETTDVSSSCGTCAGDAGVDAGAPAKAPPPSSSCGIVGGGGATGLLGAGLAIAALAAQRRRSKRAR